MWPNKEWDSPNRCHGTHTSVPWCLGVVVHPHHQPLSHRDSPRPQEGVRRETSPSYSTLCGIRQAPPLYVKGGPKTQVGFGRPPVSNQFRPRLDSRTSTRRNFAVRAPNPSCEHIFGIYATRRYRWTAHSSHLDKISQSYGPPKIRVHRGGVTPSPRPFSWP